MSFEEENTPLNAMNPIESGSFSRILQEEFTDKQLEGLTYIQAVEKIYQVSSLPFTNLMF